MMRYMAAGAVGALVVLGVMSVGAAVVLRYFEEGRLPLPAP